MTGQFGTADMHMHTNISDGAANVREVLAQVARVGLDVIAITDHDRLDASLWAYEHQDDYPFEIVPGCEVTAYDAHVLAWWVTERIPMRLSLEETTQAIHEAGGVAVLAHPFHVFVEETKRGWERYRSNPQIIADGGFDGIEVVNAGNILLGANAYAKHFTRNFDVARIGNSDAHTLNVIGSAQTHFPGKTAADLRRAVDQRQTRPIGGLWPPQGFASYILNAMTGKIVYEPAEPETA